MHPLHKAQAVSLLREYAGAWAAVDADATLVCGMVGYLPLALRLAGCYLAAHQLSAGEYVQELKRAGPAALELDPQHASDSVPKLMQVSVDAMNEEARRAGRGRSAGLCAGRRRTAAGDAARARRADGAT